MANHLWHHYLVIALFLALTSLGQGQDAETESGLSRRECISNCQQNCESYTYDCWYGICKGCKWMCPYACRWGITLGSSTNTAGGTSEPPLPINARTRIAEPQVRSAAAPPPQQNPAGPRGKRKRKGRRGKWRKRKYKKRKG